MLANRPEFHFADSAAMHLGATPFSIYNTYTAEQIEHLLRDAGSRVVITEQRHLDTILAAADALDSIEQVVVVDGEPRPGAISLDELAAGGDAGFDFEAAWRAVEPDDVLTLIYTSGHDRAAEGGADHPRQHLRDGPLLRRADRVPGRGADRLLPADGSRRGAQRQPLPADALRLHDHLLPGRPRGDRLPARGPADLVLRRATDLGEAQGRARADDGGRAPPSSARRPSGARRRASRRSGSSSAGDPVPDELAAGVERAEREMFSKLREQLGLDQVEACNVGAAPTPPEVIEFFHALGIPLAELWGMSETTGAGTCNPPERIKIGTMGPPAPGVEIRLAEDGEVMIKGPVVMKGYRNLPEKTAETFTEEGFLLTGDIGEFDEDGYLRIVDRKKELIITAAGQEPVSGEHRGAAEADPPGQPGDRDRRPAQVRERAADPGRRGGQAVGAGAGASTATSASLAENEELVAEVQRGVDRANQDLARVEQVKRFAILPADWEPGGDELTPTMKLKRKPILEKYAAEVEALYAD